MRLPRCEQPAGYAVTEARGRDAGEQALGNLFDASSQQAERLECQQRRGSCQWRAGGEPNENPQRGPSFGRAGLHRMSEQSGKPPSGQCDRNGNDPKRDQNRGAPLQAVTAFANPRVEHRPFRAQFDRESPQRVHPKEGIEHAGGAGEQLSGIQRVPLLRHALAQLIRSEREDLGLLQFTVELAELLR